MQNTDCKTFVSTVNFLESNEPTRLKAEQSQKVEEWDSCPVRDPKGPFFFLRRLLVTPLPQPNQQVSFSLPQWTKRKRKVLFPSPVRETRGALPFLCIGSYCLLGMEGLWSLLYYQRCLFSKAFKFLSCASHAAQGKHQILALYSPPDCIHIVHLSELRYFKNLRFSTPLSVEIQMTTLQSDEKLGKTWKSLWLFPPN